MSVGVNANYVGQKLSAGTGLGYTKMEEVLCLEDQDSKYFLKMNLVLKPWLMIITVQPDSPEKKKGEL